MVDTHSRTASRERESLYLGYVEIRNLRMIETCCGVRAAMQVSTVPEGTPREEGTYCCASIVVAECL